MLFLPHSVETDGSDIVAAQHVIEQMKATAADCAILEQDCGPRLLKSIIGQCDFLVGERTHSLIGSVSVGTPFAAMTNRQDTRTHGIIGEDVPMRSPDHRHGRCERGGCFAEDLRRCSRGGTPYENPSDGFGRSLSRQIEETVRMIKGLSGECIGAVRNRQTIEPVVKRKLCTGCGTCAGVCPQEAIRWS